MKLVNGVYLYEKEDFNKGLDEFLKGEHTLQKGQNMESKERLTQVRKNIKLLQEEEKRIEKELAKDPIERYIEEHPFYDGNIEIVENNCGMRRRKLKIQFPIANEDWTWRVFKYAKEFCENVILQNGGHPYPIHYEELSSKYLWIQL